jgi:hypothetical protein
MYVLAIGNSFSQDATRYLAAAARAQGVELHVANLYIGGCELSRHYRNMLTDARCYKLEYDGVSTGFSVSMTEALLTRDWDVVTVQQASPKSADYNSYQPYLSALADHVRKCVPHARLFVHQTWAYEACSPRYAALGFATPAQMMAAVKDTYAHAAREIGADGTIPSGELLLALLEAGIPKVHRDMHHADFGAGRYGLALLWLAVLAGVDVRENPFCDFDVPVPAAVCDTVRRCVAQLAARL